MTTTDDTRFVVVHAVDVFHHEHTRSEPGGQRHRAECSCGWTGDWHSDSVLAEVDGEDHRMIAVGPDDGLDATISGLLDLQDDLAEAVMWLAEHWSADLPAPMDYGTGDPAAVVLLTFCSDDAELSRVAGLLGVELVDAAGPDSTGIRYRRATRYFGRVSLRAYRRLDEVCRHCGGAFTEDLCPTCRAVVAGAA